MASKDDQIFELEATAAASKAESSHLTKKAEAAAQNRVHLVEEELRRSRTEAQKFKNNWLKQRKRVLELEKNKQDVTNQNLDTNNNSLQGRGEGKVSSWGMPSDARVSPNLGASASKKNDPMLEEGGGGGEYEVDSSSNLSGSKRKTRREPAFVEPTALAACEKSRPLETIHQRTARHILSQIEMASYRQSHGFDIPSEDTSEIDRAEDEHKNENARLERVRHCDHMKALRSDVQRGGEIEQSVQSLVYLMSEDPSTSGSMSTSGLVYSLVQTLNSLFSSTSMEKCQTDDDGDQVMQFDTGRRLSLMVSSKALPKRPRRSESSYVSYSTISWRGALFIIHVMHDVLLLSGSARESLRWWLYHSHQSSVGIGSDCRQAEPPAQVESSRIIGLPSGFLARRSRRDRSEVLWSSTCRSTHQTLGWDPTTMTQPCNTFFELLVSLMRGNFANLDDTHIVERPLLCALQLKSIELMLVLMRDAPPFDQAGANQGNGTPYLWKFLFDSLITSDATSSYQIGDLFSVWEGCDNSCEHILGSGRKHGTRLLPEATKTKDPSEKTKLSQQSSDSSAPLRNAVNQSQSHRSTLEVKTRVIELLCHFIEQSSSVRQSVYEVVDAERSPRLSKRLLAAVLDDIDERIIPFLSSEYTTSDSIDVECHLHLCAKCIDFILVLLDSDEGTRLVRMQMRLEAAGDDWSQWSQSSIGCMTRLLNQALLFGASLVDSQATADPGILSMINAIVDKSVRFFNVMLSIVHKKQRGTSRVSSFLALIAENRDLFVSCCHRIAATMNASLEVRDTISVLLDEVEADCLEEGK